MKNEIRKDKKFPKKVAMLCETISCQNPNNLRALSIFVITTFFFRIPSNEVISFCSTFS